MCYCRAIFSLSIIHAVPWAGEPWFTTVVVLLPQLAPIDVTIVAQHRVSITTTSWGEHIIWFKFPCGGHYCVYSIWDLTSQDSFLLILVHKIHIYHITSFAQQFSLLHTLKHDLQKIQFHNHDLLKKSYEKMKPSRVFFFLFIEHTY